MTRENDALTLPQVPIWNRTQRRQESAIQAPGFLREMNGRL